MASYLLRRLLIAVPSLLGISVVLFAVLLVFPKRYLVRPAFTAPPRRPEWRAPWSLQLAGAGALTVYLALPGVKAQAAIATKASRLALEPDQLSTYISINQDGSAVGWVGKIDMGQGTDIGWIKMIA